MISFPLTNLPLRALRLAAFFAILLPGTWYAWQWRTMPHAGEYHDDGIYYVSAKSLAESDRYHIESLPLQPPQAKYPPLWPAVLSLVWHLVPHYPDNLPLAMLACWIWLPLTLYAYSRMLGLAGLSPDAILLLATAWAMNPYVVLFSTAMLSEMQFTFLLLVAIVCLHSRSRGWAVMGGLLAGAAFLTRTAGIALLPAAIVWYTAREQFHLLRRFLLAMLPLVLSWTIWSVANREEGSDAISLYYTNYFGHYLANFHWSEAHLFVWKNLDGMLHGLGALLLPDTTQSLLDKVLAEVLAIAGILGVVRLVREERSSIYVPYATFACVYTVLLVIWHFPPTERLVLPLVPLWLAGVYTEFRRLAANIAQVFGKKETSQRIAGGLIAGLVATLVLFCGARQWNLLTDGLPRFYEEHAERLAASEPAMTWIRANVPADARFLAENDLLLYLRTGRRGAGLQVLLPTVEWYREDHAARTARFAAAVDRANEFKLDYFLLNEWDYSRDMPAEEHAKLMETLREDTRLEELFASGPSVVYRVR